MKHSNRRWEGKAVTVSQASGEGRQPIGVYMTPQAARTLALSLGRIKQMTFSLPGDVQELLTALDYVMVGDPSSTRKHAELETAKGMTPDGGYKAPEPRVNP